MPIFQLYLPFALDKLIPLFRPIAKVERLLSVNKLLAELVKFSRPNGSLNLPIFTSAISRLYFINSKDGFSVKFGRAPSLLGLIKGPSK